MKFLLLLSFGLWLVQGPPSVQLEFSRMDGSIWRMDSNRPWDRVYAGNIGSLHMVGTRTNNWAGHWYWIDAQADELVRDGVFVGPLIYYGTNIWDAYRIHGFAIDAYGRGWLATTDDPDATSEFLLRVDLATGMVTYMGYIDLPNVHLINGMQVLDEWQLVARSNAPAIDEK